jgi:hypothetical protein
MWMLRMSAIGEFRLHRAPFGSGRNDRIWGRSRIPGATNPSQLVLVRGLTRSHLLRTSTVEESIAFAIRARILGPSAPAIELFEASPAKIG